MEGYYPSNAKEYLLLDQIGKGMSNNVVWKAIIPSRNNEEVAIKIIDLDEYNQENLEIIRKEVQIMNISREKHIVTYYRSFVEGTKLWLVMKMLAVSCLELLRNDYPNGIEDETAIAFIIRSALLGLEYLHSHSQLHRDIKSANILLSLEGEVQLADFGVSAALDARDQRRTTFVGTVCYMAPEVLDPSETGGYNHKADIWSLGITAIELAYGKPPYALNQPMKVIMLIMKNPSPSLDIPEYQVANLVTPANRHFSSQFKDFVSHCLRKSLYERPNTQQLLKHPFIANLPDEIEGQKYLKNLLSKRVSNKIPLSKAVSIVPNYIKPEEEDLEWDFEQEMKQQTKKKDKDYDDSISPPLLISKTSDQHGGSIDRSNTKNCQTDIHTFKDNTNNSETKQKNSSSTIPFLGFEEEKEIDF